MHERYQRLGTIAKHQFGTVYKVRDLGISRVIALKVIESTPSAMSGAEVRERFLRACRAQASVEHENIVPLFFVSEINGQLLCGMELAEGGSLADRMRGERRIREPVGIIWQICRAVAGLHQRGIVHRNITPRSVVFADKDVPKLVGFDWAKATDDKAIRSIDIRGLGLLLIQWLAGAESSGSAVTSDSRTKRSAVDRLPGDVPNSLRRICGRCLGTDDLYSDVDTFAEDLHRFLIDH